MNFQARGGARGADKDRLVGQGLFSAGPAPDLEGDDLDAELGPGGDGPFFIRVEGRFEKLRDDTRQLPDTESHGRDPQGLLVPGLFLEDLEEAGDEGQLMHGRT